MFKQIAIGEVFEKIRGGEFIGVAEEAEAAKEAIIEPMVLREHSEKLMQEV